MNLVSGASGFIGRRLTQALQKAGEPILAPSRRSVDKVGHPVMYLSNKSTLTEVCSGVATVFHCAGYAHAFGSLTDADEALHWQVNFEGTRNLVEAAGQAGVRRFVFLSSVKAMGEPGESCADESFPGQPETAYGQAKRAAEDAVLEAGRRYGMHVVNLRLAMVYGSGGRGNLERMGRLVKRGLFPPLPETGNRRSLVHVDDVVSVMRLVAADNRASGKTYIVASPEAPSGRELFDALRTELGMPQCTWSIPTLLLRFAASCGDAAESMVRRRMPLDSDVLDRLLGSAWYSPAFIERDLGWRTQVSLANGLEDMLGK